MKKIKSSPLDLTGARTKVKEKNKEIKNFFYQVKGNAIRHGIVPGNSKTLWDTVKTAKDINKTSLPEEMFYEQSKLILLIYRVCFGTFFQTKYRQ